MHAAAPSLGWVETRRRGRVAAAVRVLTFEAFFRLTPPRRRSHDWVRLFTPDLYFFADVAFLSLSLILSQLEMERTSPPGTNLQKNIIARGQHKSRRNRRRGMGAQISSRNCASQTRRDGNLGKLPMPFAKPRSPKRKPRRDRDADSGKRGL